MDGTIAMVEGCEVRVDQNDFSPYLHVTLRLPLVRREDLDDGVMDHETHAMLVGHAILEQSRIMLALTGDAAMP